MYVCLLCQNNVRTDQANAEYNNFYSVQLAWENCVFAED